MMKRLLLGMAILPFVAGVALAAQPLTDKQMDKVTAGHTFSPARDDRCLRRRHKRGCSSGHASRLARASSSVM